MLAQDICNRLKAHGLCKNDEEFSYHFLGKSDRYFSTVKSKGMELPLGSKTILAARLSQLIICLTQSEDSRRRYDLTINSLKGALNELRKEINQQSLKGFTGIH